MKNGYPFPTHVINLKKRPDRLQSIQNEFSGRNEFNVSIVEAIEHSNGATGLWQTICSIIEKTKAEEFIIICEDDHQFTSAYSANNLNLYIEEGKKHGVDVLLGGISWFNVTAQISDNLFSVDTFSATQFLIVFKKFYNKILDAEFYSNDCADYKIAALSTNKMVIYPFISIQKEFGYSDTTSKNNNFGRVTAIFNSSIERLKFIDKIWTANFKNNIKLMNRPTHVNSLLGTTISTYILPPESHQLNSENILSQFEQKKEFDITIVTIQDGELDANPLFFIQKIISNAKENNEERILICSSGHQFTASYSKNYLFESLQIAQQGNAKLILGGTDDVGSAVAFNDNLYWIDWFANSRFIIVFKNCFDEILNLSKRSNMTLSMIFNAATSNKCLIYPFISEHPNTETEQVSIETTFDLYKRMNFLKKHYARYNSCKII